MKKNLVQLIILISGIVGTSGIKASAPAPSGIKASNRTQILNTDNCNVNSKNTKKVRLNVPDNASIASDTNATYASSDSGTDNRANNLDEFLNRHNVNADIKRPRVETIYEFEQRLNRQNRKVDDHIFENRRDNANAIAGISFLTCISCIGIQICADKITGATPKEPSLNGVPGAIGALSLLTCVVTGLTGLRIEYNLENNH